MRTSLLVPSLSERVSQQPAPSQYNTHPVILDGSTGAELQTRLKRAGIPIAFDGSWSAGMMATSEKAREILQQIHLDYLRAGATVITTNTYSVHPSTAKTLDIPLEDLVRYAVEACFGAREQFRQEAGEEAARNILIAGSVPPLRVSFRPDLVPSDEILRAEYAELVQALLRAKVDVLQIETLSTLREAKICAEVCCREAAAAGVAGHGPVEVWLGVAVEKGAKLVSGEPVERLVEGVWGRRSGEVDHADNSADSSVPVVPAVLLFNCSTMENIEEALEKVTTGGGRHLFPRLGAYPNRIMRNVGDLKTEAKTLEKNGDPQLWDNFPLCSASPSAFAERVWSWHARYGVSYLGACCLFGPEFIQALSDQGGSKMMCGGARTKVDVVGGGVLPTQAVPFCPAAPGRGST